MDSEGRGRYNEHWGLTQPSGAAAGQPLDMAAYLTRLISQTLAVTTNGDQDVVRQNGWQWAKVSEATVPPGGGVEFTPGNERYRFRNVGLERRRFWAHARPEVWQGSGRPQQDSNGAYSTASYREVPKMK